MGHDALRVSVVGGHERVDLVVPAGLPVAELLPDLVRRLGAADPLPPGTVRLSVLGGGPLRPDDGLADQGVADGSLLTLTAETDHVPPPTDDLARAVGEAAESLPRPEAAVVRRATVVLGSVLLGLVAAAVVVEPSVPAAALAGGLAALLVLLAAVAVRRGAPLAATAAGWLAVVHAGSAGAVAGPVPAGLAIGVAGGLALLATRLVSLAAAPVVGVVLALTGAVPLLAPVPLALAATVALPAAVLVGDQLPWLAAALAGLRAPPLGEQPPALPDPTQVARAVRRAHAVLLAGSVATALLLAVLGPLAATRGRWGLAVALLCCAVVALRARRQRAGTSGPPALAGALLALLPVTGAAWATRPEVLPPLLAAVAVVGLAALGAAAVAPLPSVRAGRVAEVAEALVLVALPPTLLAATGTLGLVRQLVT